MATKPSKTVLKEVQDFRDSVKGVWGAMEPKTNVRKISTHFIE